jgi:hypothetical protein
MSYGGEKEQNELWLWLGSMTSDFGLEATDFAAVHYKDHARPELCLFFRVIHLVQLCLQCQIGDLGMIQQTILVGVLLSHSEVA